jgi:ribonucleotide reductase beta subunit family protein with ferritin-like domain
MYRQILIASFCGVKTLVLAFSSVWSTPFFERATAAVTANHHTHTPVYSGICRRVAAPRSHNRHSGDTWSMEKQEFKAHTLGTKRNLEEVSRPNEEKATKDASH